MRTYDELFALAAARKGSQDFLADLPFPPKPADDLAQTPDHRILAGFSRYVFSTGLNWSVIANKWPGFEEAFEGFDIGRWCLMSDEDLDRLLADTRIIRHAGKIRSVAQNAQFLAGLAREHGSAAAAVAHWPATDHVGLLRLMKERGARLGGTSAQYALRSLGRDSFLLSGDVLKALAREGVVDNPQKAPTGKAALARIQAAFTTWMAQSGRSLSEISRTLALGVD